MFHVEHSKRPKADESDFISLRPLFVQRKPPAVPGVQEALSYG
ncbi:hypothetical protein HMPREF7215_2402 [Pyramidobacter piscolens W5455]|uniref:Uncharacterized protein n=1 Tax=Pyramidobacter piscolens W5455 TaxID=352165 RepID=A0ABP2HQK6_9BACT|nr:hypothetical protein HMPREF7215_2402 [Pyramidobacter piscolens W5455]